MDEDVAMMAAHYLLELMESGAHIHLQGPDDTNERTTVPDNIMAVITWNSAQVVDVTASALTAKMSANGKDNYNRLAVIKISTLETMRPVHKRVLTVARPLFFKVLRAYQTEILYWDAHEFFAYLCKRDGNLASTYRGSSEGECYMDPLLFDTITVISSTPEKEAEAVADRLLLQTATYTSYIKTGSYHYQYQIMIPVDDLSVSMDTLLSWLQKSAPLLHYSPAPTPETKD